MDTIIIIDFGSQYSHLIARRVRDLGVYAEILPSSTQVSKLRTMPHVKGIILSGGAASVLQKKSPTYSRAIFNLGVPVLGICYGHQLIAKLKNGKVVTGKQGEYGSTLLRVVGHSELFRGLKTTTVWMNHKDVVMSLPHGFTTTAITKESPIAAYENTEKQIYSLQFHPEVEHTAVGNVIFKRFTFDVCHARKQWKAQTIARDITREIKTTLGKHNAIIGLSGGIDSTTAAVLVGKAIGKRLTAVYVDTGLMRKGETEFIRKTFSKHRLNLQIIDARNDFFQALQGVTDPEKKRKIIGRIFVAVFDRASKETDARFLIQGTIYSDRIESGLTKNSSTIKSHHNVGGLPKKMKLMVYEPLRDLYKDEVRRIARELGVRRDLIARHAFPGPGLAVRIVGEVTKERAAIVRHASFIVEDELKRAKLYEKVWMAFAVLLPIKSVGIQGDARSYKYAVVVRIIESTDAMTATFSKIPYRILEKISTRITNEVKQVNRVVYDISNKPPATMEWE